MTGGENTDHQRLREALKQANVPTLLAVLAEFDGFDESEPPFTSEYRPTRAKGMDTHPTGGLDEATQADVRERVVAAVTAWEAAGRPPRRALDGEEIARILSFTTAETVPADFEAMLADLVNPPREALHSAGRLRNRSEVSRAASRCAAVKGNGPSVIVIGAGIGGLLTSTALGRAGIEHVVLEKNTEVGGSWWENRYPGAGVDTPSHLYSISDFDHDWSSHFSKRDEVQRYLEAYADANDLRSRIRFGIEVEQAVWDDAANRWHLRARTSDGAEVHLSAPIVISAVGQLNRPRLPDVPGLDDFEGRWFHSANWPVDLDHPDSLRGKRVGIVGAGASAMQIAPAIVDRVGSLTVFQRSPGWIAPSDDYFRAVPDGVHDVMELVPGYREWYRARLSWIFNDKVHSSLQVDPDWSEPELSINAVNHGHRGYYERYLRTQLADRPDLIEHCLPGYPPFGKRMLIDNGWFEMLKHPRTTLVPHGVTEVSANGLIDADGVEHDLDVVIFATGFATTRLLHPMEVIGRSGRSTTELWGEHDARAYLGMTIPDFPNLFLLTGPNTALGHGGSFITILECQVHYILDALRQMGERGLGSIECRAGVEADYTEAVDEAHARMVWTHPGVENWYRNAEGRVVAVLPWRVVDYWNLTRAADLDAFHTRALRTHWGAEAS